MRFVNDHSARWARRNLENHFAVENRTLGHGLALYPVWTMKGLIIRSPYVDWILAGKKIWEIRGSYSHIRGKIALIRGGSGLIVGTCELVSVVGPLNLRQMWNNSRKLGQRKSEIRSLRYKTTYAWVLRNARKLKRPLRYKHPSGAVIWVKLPNF